MDFFEAADQILGIEITIRCDRICSRDPIKIQKVYIKFNHIKTKISVLRVPKAPKICMTDTPWNILLNSKYENRAKFGLKIGVQNWYNWVTME
jgi:hypothetical protein